VSLPAIRLYDAVTGASASYRAEDAALADPTCAVNHGHRASLTVLVRERQHELLERADTDQHCLEELHAVASGYNRAPRAAAQKSPRAPS